MAVAGDLPFFMQANFITLSTALLLCATPDIHGLNEQCGWTSTRKTKAKAIKRVRKSMCEIFREHGPVYARRAYRMEEATFWKLCWILGPYMLLKKKRKASKKKKTFQRKGAENGIIPTPTKISVALRWFAGGSACDMALVHGISHSDVFNCVWKVVDAVNKCEEMAFSFPTNHEAQHKIARGFQRKSVANFDKCCGAVDGILIWMERPSENSCKEAGCGPKKFFCGRKKKFGMNMQGTVDHHGRFLDMSVWHPASTSDYLSFSAMDLFHKLEKGLLAPGLCLFGDNAYVNAPYMATPFKNVGGGSKDDHNFFHSQVRIGVECAFGVFVQRWGVLRKALSTKITMKKVNCLCMSLCRLHNFCIDARIKPPAMPVPTLKTLVLLLRMIAPLNAVVALPLKLERQNYFMVANIMTMCRT